MSAETPETVDEFESLLARLEVEAIEAKQMGDRDWYLDARRAYTLTLAEFNKTYPPKTQAEMDAYMEEYRAKTRALAIEEGRA